VTSWNRVLTTGSHSSSPGRLGCPAPEVTPLPPLIPAEDGWWYLCNSEQGRGHVGGRDSTSICGCSCGYDQSPFLTSLPTRTLISLGGSTGGALVQWRSETCRWPTEGLSLLMCALVSKH
jgi:hypothetical protein